VELSINNKKITKIITYGTFDMFHIGHLNLLKRAKSLGDYLIVGISTDEFNQLKGKKSLIPFKERVEIIKSIKWVDEVIAENSWEQKIEDIKNFNIDIFVIGDDWKGEFDFLEKYCQVVYLSRTQDISTTILKNNLKSFYNIDVDGLKRAIETIENILKALD
jgi:glycerol-3-phosphate cytidylyltransferase